MRSFLDQNSEDNPFVIPAGSTFIDALNALDWGENVTVVPAMEVAIPRVSYGGGINLFLNFQEHGGGKYTAADHYLFPNVTIYVQYADSSTTRPTLPQTGAIVSFDSVLVGSSMVVLATISAYFKKK